MNDAWNRFPVARLLLPFLLGIVWAIYTPPLQPWAIYAMGGGIVLFAFLQLHQINKYIRWQPIIGIISMVSMFLAGMALVQYKTHIHHPNHYSHYATKALYWEAKLTAPPTVKENSILLTLSITTVFTNDTTQGVFGKAYAYLPKEMGADTLGYGTVVLLDPLLQPVAAPANPYAFNYKQYLAYQQITHQGYFPAGSWQIIKTPSRQLPMNIVWQARQYLRTTTYKYLQDSTAAAVATALLLGQKDGLDDATKDAYAKTGAMHVLAVSGLHVGIIFLVLQRLFNLIMLPFSKGKYISAVLQLLGIWSFALLTGLTPSVTRAATMFTFIIVGQQLKRPVHVYNSIAASALLLLAFQPYLVTQVGFQLSYAAVFGIVYFQPRLYRLWYVKNKVLDWIWQITCVSIAAQLGTFVLGIFYFHQFPTYFMVSNLLVIPAAIGILHAGLLLFLVSPWPLVADFVGTLLREGILVLNSCIHQIETWPHAILSPLTLNPLQGILIYILLISSSFWLIHYYNQLRLIALGSLALLISSFTWQHLERQTQKGITVYAIRGHTAINYHNGATAFLLVDTALLIDYEELDYQTALHGVYAGWKNWKKLAVEDLPVAGIVCNNVAWWQAPPAQQSPANTTTLILSSNHTIRPEHVLQLPQLKQLVLDGSHSKASRKFWHGEAEKYGWDCHLVDEDGAYIVGW